MTVPLSERAIIAIVDQLETISIVAGYHTNAGASVFRAKRSFSPEELPALSVFESNEVPNTGSASTSDAKINTALGIDVVAHVIADDEPGSALGLIKADVKRCIMAWAKNLDGSDISSGVRDDDGPIGTLKYFGADSNPREDGAVSESVSVRFVVLYPEGFGDPNQPL